MDIYGTDRPRGDIIYGTSDSDRIYGYGGDDYLFGLDGDDYIDGGTGNDTLYGDAGNDTLLGGTGNDILDGGSGDDFLSGDDGNDILDGGSGNDQLTGGAGADTLYGGLGDDTYYYSDPNDYAQDVIIENADEGIDTLISFFNVAVLPNNVENLTLSERRRLFGGIDGGGNSLNNTISGNRFDNTLSGYGGNDTLLGGDGNDTLYGGDGNDFLAGTSTTPGAGGKGERDILSGGAGADMFFLGKTYYGSVVKDQRYPYSPYAGDGAAGYATITDFNRLEGDKVLIPAKIFPNSPLYESYTVDKSMNLGGTSALDTALYYQGDLIAVIQDNTSFDIRLDSVPFG